MTGNSSTARTKARAIFLAALMVVSVFGGTIALAGTAAANTAGNASLSTSADPGTAGQSNDIIFDTDVSGEDSSTDIKKLNVTFDTSGDSNIDTSAITADQVSVTGDDTGNPGVDSVSKVDDKTIEVVMADTFTLGGESGNIAVTIADVRPTDGTFTSELEFRDGDGNVIASDTDDYTVEGFEADVTAEPDTVFEDEITEVAATVNNHPDGETGDYTVYAGDTSGTEVVSGTTDDGTFSFTADPAGDNLTAGDVYTLKVVYGDQKTMTTVQVAPSVNLDITSTPSEPTVGDNVEFDGTFTADDGDRPDKYDSLQLVYGEDTSNQAVVDFRVLSNGAIDVASGTLDDAGTYTVVYSAGSNKFALETITVGSAQGNLSLQGDPVAGNDQNDFTAMLTDANGDGVELTESTPTNNTYVNEDATEGFVVVDGNFTTTTNLIDDGTVLRVVGYTDGDGTTVYDIAGADTLQNVVDNEDKIVEFHATTTADGALNFSADPTTADQTIDVSLATRTDEGDGFSTDALATGGVEDRTFVSFGTLDLVADGDSVGVDTGDALNVDVTTKDSAGGKVDTLNVDRDDQQLTVSVTGEDFNEVSDSTDTALDFAEVNISSEQLVGDSPQTITAGVDADQTSGPVTFDTLNFEEGGEVLVEVTAEEIEDGETVATYTYNTTLTVEGETVTQLTPTEVTAGAEEDVEIGIETLDGSTAVDRQITLTHSKADGFGDGVQEITLTADDFNADSDTFIRENVSFELPGTVDVTVSEDQDNDGTYETVTADLTESIDVSGEERYDVRTNESLLAGSPDDIVLEVYDISGDEAQLVNDSSELSELAGNIELSQGGDATVVSQSNVETDAANGTITIVDARADGADLNPVNVTVSTDDDAFTGDGQIEVVAPQIETDLGGDILTEGVTTNVTVTVTDPRDGSAVTGDIRFSGNGTSLDVDTTDVAADGSTTVSLDENGTASVDITFDELADPANDTLVLDASPEADDMYFSTTNVEVGELQLTEREGGENVDLREEIVETSEEEVVFLLRDANGDRLDGVDVTLAGDGFSSGTSSYTTEEGFFDVNFANVDLQTATLEFSADADATVTAGTVEVVPERTDVNLSATVDPMTIDEGGENVTFEVVREDYQATTTADVTISNASGEVVKTYSIDEPEAQTFNVSLEPGEYTVTFSKDSSNTKNFVNATSTLTVNEVVEPGAVNVENVSLAPDTVETNTTNDHTLTFDAENVSDDGNTDTFTVTFPSAATLDNVNDVSVVDAAGENVSITSSAELVDNGTAVEFSVSPDSDGEYRDLTVTVDATVTAPDVSNETTADVTAAIADSSNGEDSETTTLTIGSVAEPTANLMVESVDGPENVTAGENLTVSAVVANNGSAEGTDTVDVTLDVNGNGVYGDDGDVTASEEVTVAAGANTTVDLTLDTGNVSAGTYTYTAFVGDSDASQNVTIQAAEEEAPVIVGDTPAQDPDDDGLYEDVNGDDVTDVGDVQALFSALDSDSVESNTDLFDFNGDGVVDVGDVQALFASLN